MAQQTKISWADSTINWWSGCTKVSPGCAHCYAETRDKRHMIEARDHWGAGAPRLKHVGAVKQALAMNRKPWICDDCGRAFTHWSNASTCSCEMGQHSVHRRRIFSLSLGDWLDAEVPIEWFVEIMQTVLSCEDVTWILCSKRPENFQKRMAEAIQYLDSVK